MLWQLLRTSMLTQVCTCIDMCFVSDDTITKVVKLNTVTRQAQRLTAGSCAERPGRPGSDREAAI